MKHIDRIKNLIKEVLSTPPKKEKCNCGCHSCKNVGNPGPVLNESLNAKIVMTENMLYHVKNKLPLTENTFRYGSQAFLDLWAEARFLYSRNAIHVNDIDKEILIETNLGEYGMFEGQKVPLDMPMLEEMDKEFNINKVWDFLETKPFYNKEYMPMFSTAKEIYNEFDPKALEMYSNFDWKDKWGGEIHPREKKVLQRISNYEKLSKLKEQDSELGEKEDVEFTTNVFMVPYLPLLQAIEKDWGRRDLYYEVEQAIFDKDLNRVKRVLRDYEMDKEYSHLLGLNENKYKPIKEDIALYGKVYESIDIENSYKIEDTKFDSVSSSFIFTDKHGIKRKLQYFKGNSVKLLWFDPSTQKWTTEKIPSKYEDDKVMNTFGKILVKVILPKYGSFHFIASNMARYRLFRALIYNSLDTLKYDMNFNDDKMEIEVILKSPITEATDKKHPPLNKPHRGGSKKFYVYVRDPKSKRIKKVSFGDTTGLSAKINNPKARQAFAKRHDCANKKDKTKASYWSCRLPRYSKLLGLKSTFSGYW